jgi:hypothetical protein
MANLLYGSENFSTTLNVGGGINNSQTTGLVLTSVSSLNANGGILGLDWATSIDTSSYEEIEYGSYTGNELTGVVRGVNDTSAKTHLNGATVVAVISQAHQNRIVDKLKGTDTGVTLISPVINTGVSGTANITTQDNTQTLTNKRRTRRVGTVTQAASPAMNTDNMDVASITGLAQAITSMTTNLTGTPVAGDLLEIQITDNATPRAITWGASFVATTAALPTTTVTSTMLRVFFEYNGSTWSCLGSI